MFIHYHSSVYEKKIAMVVQIIRVVWLDVNFLIININGIASKSAFVHFPTVINML